MLLRRFAFNYQYFTRVLFSTSRKISHLYFKNIRAKYTLLFASALTFTRSSLLRRQHLILCEEKQDNMGDIKTADDLYNEHKFEELHNFLLDFKESEDPELLWRVVRAHRDRANMEGVSEEDKKKLIFEALEISKRALEFGKDNNYACHKWYGIMLSQTGDYLGTKHKLDKSPEMKVHFEKAIELNPDDATSRYLIGMWCFSFADLAWYERKIAAVVFGAPPTSTYDEALQHFLEAEKINPGFYSANQYMIGLVHLKMGDKSAAKEMFEKVLEYEVVKDEDKENVKKAKDQLKYL